MTGLTIIISLLITINLREKDPFRIRNKVTIQTTITSKNSLNSYFSVINQVISIFQFSSLFNLEGPTKLPLTGATSSDIEEEAKAT